MMIFKTFNINEAKDYSNYLIIRSPKLFFRLAILEYLRDLFSNFNLT